MVFEQYYILYLIVMSTMGFSLMAPIIPPNFVERKLSNQICSFLLAIFPLVELIITIYSPVIIRKYGRKRLYFISILMIPVTLFFYGLIINISNNTLFLILMFIDRIFQAAFSIIECIISFSLASIINPKDEVQQAIGLNEMAETVGYTIGPFIINIFYPLGGATLSFFGAGVLNLFSLFAYYRIPMPNDDEENEEKKDEKKDLKKEYELSTINNENNNKRSSPDIFEGNDNLMDEKIILENKNQDNSNKKEENNSLLPLLKYPFILLNLTCIMFSSMAYNFELPILTNYLKDEFDIPEEKSSFFYMAYSIGYFINVFFSKKLTDFLGLFLSVSIGLFLTSLFLLFIAPIYFLPQKVSTMVVGQFTLGLTGVIINLPIYVIINNFVFKLINDENVSDDISSAIYNFCFIIGEIWEVILSSWINKHWGFKITAYFTSTLNFMLGILYVFYYYDEIKKQVEKIVNRKRNTNIKGIGFDNDNKEKVLKDFEGE